MFNDDINYLREQRRRDFEKLACEPCLKEAKVGDRVLVSAGAAGRGFEWERLEAIVKEVADTAYKLHFISRHDDVAWIHKFIVTDVLGEA